MRLVTDEMEESIRAERTDLFYELFEGREDVAFLSTNPTLTKKNLKKETCSA